MQIRLSLALGCRGTTGLFLPKGRRGPGIPQLVESEKLTSFNVKLAANFQGCQSYQRDHVLLHESAALTFWVIDFIAFHSPQSMVWQGPWPVVYHCPCFDKQFPNRCSPHAQFTVQQGFILPHLITSCSPQSIVVQNGRGGGGGGVKNLSMPLAHQSLVWIRVSWPLMTSCSPQYMV